MAYPQQSFKATKIVPDSIIGRRRDVARRNMLLYQLQTLKTTGRYNCFKLQWHPIYDRQPEVWPIPDHQFWDSDIAKWIEGAVYFLRSQGEVDPEVDAAVKELVHMLRTAQQPDGYLNLHYQVVEPGKRFTNLRDMHELYNAGHLIEAALAHEDHYHDGLMLDPILRYVNLLCDTFGPSDGQIHGYPGHPEIELALLRLYERTKDPKHLALAQYFIAERGNPSGAGGQHFFKHEACRRSEQQGQRPEMYPLSDSFWYQQAHVPLIEQETIEGHSVRAMYLLTAAADLVRLGSDAPGLRVAISRLWNNMTSCKMYVTGGIGAIKQWEGFGIDHYLPQSTTEGGCYAETCAAIGVMMLAERILQYDLDGRYSDIMELCLFNSVLTAMSLDGKAFTYVNQLGSSEQDLSSRDSWFTVCCCPPNILRLLGNIGGYIWTVQPGALSSPVDVNVHLYLPASLDFEAQGSAARLEQTSNWPWEGKIRFSLAARPSSVRLRLRVPAWAPQWTIEPPLHKVEIEAGYLTVPPSYLDQHPQFHIDFPLEPRLVASHPLSHPNSLSIVRGPIVYCVEDVDNPWVTDHFRSVYLDPHCITKGAVSEVTKNHTQPSCDSESYVAITVDNGAYTVGLDDIKSSAGLEEEELHALMKRRTNIAKLHFVPYYYKANRCGKGMARVGLRRGSGTQP